MPRVKATAGPYKRDGEVIRAPDGAILAQGWPCIPPKRRRATLNLMAAAPMLREALRNIEREAQRAIQSITGSNPAAAALEHKAALDRLLDETQAALAGSVVHPAVRSGHCDICGHYGADCTGE